MIVWKQEGSDVVAYAQDRSYGSVETEVLRLGPGGVTLPNGTVDSASIADSAVSPIKLTPNVSVMRKVSLTIDHTELAALGAGVKSFDKYFPALPPWTRQFGAVANIHTDFAGTGGWNYLKLGVGDDGDFANGYNATTTTGNGDGDQRRLEGSVDFRSGPDGSTTATLTVQSFTSGDVAIDLNNATSGSLTLDLFYMVVE